MSFNVMSYIRSNAKFFYARVVLSRVTTAFFIFTLVFCITQAIIQIVFHALDRDNSNSLAQIVGHSQIPVNNFAFLESSGMELVLQICDDIPHGQTPYPCTTILNTTRTSQDSDRATYLPHISLKQTLADVAHHRANPVSVVQDSHSLQVGSTNEMVEVTLNHTEATVELSNECIQVLVYPSQVLANFGREDIAFFFFQVWLCAVSFQALFYGSIPHLMAVFAARVLAWAWSISVVWRTPLLRNEFQQMLAGPQSPCSLDPFTHFWSTRQGYQIADLVLSSISVSLFAYLSTTLFKVFDEESFARLGAPRHVLRINKFFLALLACLQMEAFVLVASTGLWADTLMTTVIARLSSHTVLYQCLWITTTIVIIPWIVMGWHAIRREMRKTMIAFLGLAFVITANWAIMFYSIVYRWSFVNWPFLACLTVSSFVLLTTSMVLGVICRRNFGKGLAEYLRAERALASLNFVPDKFSNDDTSSDGGDKFHTTTTGGIRHHSNDEKKQRSLSPSSSPSVFHVPLSVTGGIGPSTTTSSLDSCLESGNLVRGQSLQRPGPAIQISVTQSQSVS